LLLMELPPGRYNVRLAAMRDGDRATGSVFTDVDVPEVSKEPLAVSDVLVEVTPAALGGPRNAFSHVVPAIPTTRRHFRQTDSATAFFRVHQGGDAALRDATIAVTIVNERDRVVAEAKGELSAARFEPDTRRLDHRFAIPLASLTPGQYLLRFDVGLGDRLMTRQVRFGVE
jgi:hypothetical protein